MSFILRRLLFYVVAAWVALTVNFFIPRAMPGNAVQSVMAKFPNLQPSAYKALQALLGVGHPGSIWSQYVSYLNDIFHFNFGTDVPLALALLGMMQQYGEQDVVIEIARQSEPGQGVGG